MGICIFQTDEEYNESLKSNSALEKRYQRYINKVNERMKDDEKQSKEKININQLARVQDKLEAPLPNEKHVYCGVCEVNYENYKEHIKCNQHYLNVQSN